jgi:hypothetical protein
VDATMRLRVSLASAGFAVALMFAPSAHAQAESSPDHFTESGVEIGPGGQVATATHASRASVATAQAHTQSAKPATAQANHANPAAQPVQVAMTVADKNRPVVAGTPKQ